MAKVIFDTLNEEVYLSSQAELAGPFIALRKKLKKDEGEFKKIITYLHLVYDRNSVYSDVLPLDRKQMVCVDRLKLKGDEWQVIESAQEVKDCIDFINKVQYSPKERLFYGVDEKVEEYLNFWKDLKVSEKNHNIVAESVVNAAKLVKLRDDLEKQVFKSVEDAHQVGGGKAKLFEG